MNDRNTCGFIVINSDFMGRKPTTSARLDLRSIDSIWNFKCNLRKVTQIWFSTVKSS